MLVVLRLRDRQNPRLSDFPQVGVPVDFFEGRRVEHIITGYLNFNNPLFGLIMNQSNQQFILIFDQLKAFLAKVLNALRYRLHQLHSHPTALYNQSQNLPNYPSARGQVKVGESLRRVVKLQSQKTHNRYCTYALLVRQKQFQNQLQSWFPIIKHQESLLFKLQQQLEADSSLLQQDRWSTVVVNKYNIAADCSTTLTIALFLQQSGLSGESLSFLIKKLNLSSKSPKLILRQLQKFNQYSSINQISKVKAHHRVTIEHDQTVNELTVPNTTKMLFCPIDWIYDCPKHKLPIESHFYTFIHQKNLNDGTVNSPQEILQFFKTCIIGEKTLETDNFCSKRCFRLLTPQKYRKLSKSAVLPPVAKAIIRIGVEMLGFSPCLIWNLLSSNFSCQYIFIFLIEQYKSLSAGQHLLYETQTDFFDKAWVFQKLQSPQLTKKSGLEIKSVSSAYCVHFYLDKPPNLNSCSDCQCAKRGFCLLTCNCPPGCPIMICGCKCPNMTSCKQDKCACFARNMECNPDLCKNCFNTLQTKRRNKCKNNQIQLCTQSRIIVGKSELPGGGLGCFAGEVIKADDLIGRYTGQITEDQDFVREGIAKDLIFYTYGYKDKLAVDAKYFGNKTRYINHSKRLRNCKTRQVLVRQQFYIGIYALRDLKIGEELFLNYDQNRVLEKNANYPWINL